MTAAFCADSTFTAMEVDDGKSIERGSSVAGLEGSRRVANTRRDEFFCGYTPAASPTAMKSMRATIKSLDIPRQTPETLAEIAQQLNPLLRGWIAYYGRYSRSALSTLADYVNRKLRAWIMRKFKRFQSHKTRASLFVRKLARENPGLFVHWKAFGTNTFA
ncbi:group II intron maturase-specific domain-containing protein [Mesorhizobium sp. M0910]|uniref:group II intron maturase-specific domain-containing protein n=1 Tax=Mesorhizobium sp. M0910 TaxID=2957025 RepID=UPI0033372695